MAQRHPLREVCNSLGIPVEVIDSYIKMGISTLYDWQVKCLFNTKVLINGNLVYCAPTGGGKTLIAELAILKTVLVSQKKAIFVLPFVSLVLEKEKYFKKLLLQINRTRGKFNKVSLKSIKKIYCTLNRLKNNGNCFSIFKSTCYIAFMIIHSFLVIL